MPMEVRKIVFSAAEVKDAAITYCRAIGRVRPDAAITHVGIDADRHVPVSLHVRGAADRSGSDCVGLRLEDMTAALLRYCREKHIPLPRLGRKVLCPDAAGMALIITLPSTRKHSTALPVRAAVPGHS